MTRLYRTLVRYRHLSVSGLVMVKSFDNLWREDRGYATENVLTLKVPLTAAAYDEGPARAAFLREACGTWTVWLRPRRWEPPR